MIYPIIIGSAAISLFYDADFKGGSILELLVTKAIRDVLFYYMLIVSVIGSDPNYHMLGRLWPLTPIQLYLVVVT